MFTISANNRLKGFAAAGTIACAGVGPFLTTQAAAQEPLRYDFCNSGISAEALLDDLDVYDAENRKIGETEELIIGNDGRVLALIAEVGGLLGVVEAHVRVPWSSVHAAKHGCVYQFGKRHCPTFRFSPMTGPHLRTPVPFVPGK